MRVKTEARRQVILEVAGKLFLHHGFAAVSMAAVAAEVGGSRMTLYNYFPNKESLFEAFVVAAGIDVCDNLLDLPSPSAPLEIRLRVLAHNLLRLSLKPEILAIHRLIIGEALRAPGLSRIFYANGPGRTLNDLMSVITSAMDQEQLRQADPQTCALHFKVLCEAGIVEQQLWGLAHEPQSGSVNQAIDSALEVFLSAYAPRASNS
ncbi:TetR/AcrR family transcriptional regulator [Pseudomonas sp. App30]|uniref:TetR/AcrR family transcriptional regulator n=1 Tax=Pseudomonas sp. App30 TaxID=3068990 RepID=UPI003A7FCB04